MTPAGGSVRKQNREEEREEQNVVCLGQLRQQFSPSLCLPSLPPSFPVIKLSLFMFISCHISPPLLLIPLFSSLPSLLSLCSSAGKRIRGDRVEEEEETERKGGRKTE